MPFGRYDCHVHAFSHTASIMSDMLPQIMLVPKAAEDDIIKLKLKHDGNHSEMVTAILSQHSSAANVADKLYSALTGNGVAIAYYNGNQWKMCPSSLPSIPSETQYDAALVMSQLRNMTMQLEQLATAVTNNSRNQSEQLLAVLTENMSMVVTSVVDTLEERRIADMTSQYHYPKQHENEAVFANPTMTVKQLEQQTWTETFYRQKNLTTGFLFDCHCKQRPPPKARDTVSQAPPQTQCGRSVAVLFNEVGHRLLRPRVPPSTWELLFDACSF